MISYPGRNSIANALELRPSCTNPSISGYAVTSPDSKVHGTNMGPTWVLSAPDGPHIGPMNLAIRQLSVWVGALRMACGGDPGRRVPTVRSGHQLMIGWHALSAPRQPHSHNGLLWVWWCRGSAAVPETTSVRFPHSWDRKYCDIVMCLPIMITLT